MICLFLRLHPCASLWSGGKAGSGWLPRRGGSVEVGAGRSMTVLASADANRGFPARLSLLPVPSFMLSVHPPPFSDPSESIRPPLL